MRVRKSAFVGNIVAFHFSLAHETFGILQPHVREIFDESRLALLRKNRAEVVGAKGYGLCDLSERSILIGVMFFDVAFGL